MACDDGSGVLENVKGPDFVAIKTLENITEVECGHYHAVIRMADGSILVSGYNASGQLGLGDEKNRGYWTLIKKIEILET